MTVEQLPSQEIYPGTPQDQIWDLSHSLAWALSIIKQAPSAADMCPWHGRTPFPHSCPYYTNTQWDKALLLLTQAPLAHGYWTWDTATTNPPDTSDVRTNTGTWATATSLRLDHHSLDGMDQMEGIHKVATNDDIVIRDATQSSNFAQYRATGPAVAQATYCVIPVALKQAKGNLPATGTQVSVDITAVAA